MLKSLYAVAFVPTLVTVARKLSSPVVDASQMTFVTSTLRSRGRGWGVGMAKNAIAILTFSRLPLKVSVAPGSRSDDDPIPTKRTDIWISSTVVGRTRNGTIVTAVTRRTNRDINVAILHPLSIL